MKITWTLTLTNYGHVHCGQVYGKDAYTIRQDGRHFALRHGGADDPLYFYTLREAKTSAREDMEERVAALFS